jgi:hypothetical protein
MNREGMFFFEVRGIEGKKAMIIKIKKIYIKLHREHHPLTL